MSHITQAAAEALTASYRQDRETILETPYKGNNTLALSETFNVDEIKSVIDQTNCTGLRIYYGMDSSSRVHAILVGVDENDEDILPGSTTPAGKTNILEDGLRCPQHCPPSSPLNS